MHQELFLAQYFKNENFSSTKLNFELKFANINGRKNIRINSMSVCQHRQLQAQYCDTSHTAAHTKLVRARRRHAQYNIQTDRQIEPDTEEWSGTVEEMSIQWRRRRHQQRDRTATMTTTFHYYDFSPSTSSSSPAGFSSPPPSTQQHKNNSASVTPSP